MEFIFKNNFNIHNYVMSEMEAMITIIISVTCVNCWFLSLCGFAL